MEPINLTGKKFGRLTAIRRNGFLSHGKEKTKAWLCLCDCGNQKTVRQASLVTKNTKSCGCLRIETTRKMSTTHGKKNHPLYPIWKGMVYRSSLNPNVPKCYKKVSVCSEWKNFKTFYKWAIASGWEKGLCIDRENTTENYTPENCRFTTQKKNNQNARSSKRWFIQGRVFESASEAARVFKVSRSTICVWCNGRKGKYRYLPKTDCYSEKKYA